MKKTLIIPDVHDKTDRVQSILDRESFDNVVFLGDFFDSLGGSDEIAEKTARFIVKLSSDERMIFLLGNHDVNYFGNNPATLCRGYTQSKRKVIRSIIGPDIYLKWKWFHTENDILMSHGGLNKSYVHATLDSSALIAEWLHVEAKRANRSLYDNIGQLHWFMQSGIGDGGRASFGGLLWNRTNEFIPVPNVSQVFGHTPAGMPLVITKKSTYGHKAGIIDLKGDNNVCLDAHLDYYAVLIGNNLHVKKV